MRLFATTTAAAFAFGLFATGAVAAQSLSLPATLLGAWETDLANCTRTAPETGSRIEFQQTEAGGMIHTVNHETEGGGCSVAMVEAEGPTFTVAANCAAEEGPQQSEMVIVELLQQGTAISVGYANSPNVPAETFRRCAMAD